jgi:deazaflavin-dependent oxidoreductase (nitroreductase family)
MRSPIGRFVGGVVLAVLLIGVVFVAGMRAKSPPVLNTVRRFGRATKGVALRSAGMPGAHPSVVRHVGRTTGQEYETPVGAVSTGDGFVIALPYGRNTDWLKNVLASGSATIVHDGGTHRVEQPEVLPLTVVNRYFSPGDQRMHGIFGVKEGLRVRSVESAAQTSDLA